MEVHFQTLSLRLLLKKITTAGKCSYTLVFLVCSLWFGRVVDDFLI